MEAAPYPGSALMERPADHTLLRERLHSLHQMASVETTSLYEVQSILALMREDIEKLMDATRNFDLVALRRAEERRLYLADS